MKIFSAVISILLFLIFTVCNSSGDLIPDMGIGLHIGESIELLDDGSLQNVLTMTNNIESLLLTAGLGIEQADTYLTTRTMWNSGLYDSQMIVKDVIYGGISFANIAPPARWMGPDGITLNDIIEIDDFINSDFVAGVFDALERENQPLSSLFPKIDFQYPENPMMPTPLQDIASANREATCQGIMDLFRRASPEAILLYGSEFRNASDIVGENFGLNPMTVGEIDDSFYFTTQEGYQSSFFGVSLTITEDELFDLSSGPQIVMLEGEATHPMNPVPEPTTILLFGTGIVGLIGARFRRRSR